jgi:hypothetical protein
MYAEVIKSTSPGMEQALAERKAALESRAAELLRRAVANHDPWLATLGRRPTDWSGATRWTRAALSIAAYRERYEVTGDGPLGNPTNVSRRRDAARIRSLTDAFWDLSTSAPTTGVHQSTAPITGPSP